MSNSPVGRGSNQTPRGWYVTLLMFWEWRVFVAHQSVRTRGINSTEEAHQYTSENGDKYFVDSTVLKCGKRIERGHILFANGDKYEGDWTQVRETFLQDVGTVRSESMCRVVRTGTESILVQTVLYTR